MTSSSNHALDRTLTMEIVRITERAAIAAARLRGLGDERAADQVAVDAMRAELARLPVDGTVVIGEGERDAAPMLLIGEKVGTGEGPPVDIALDPLEGATLCAKNLRNSLTVIAVAERGSLLFAPDVYMEKIAIGPGYPEGLLDLDAPVADTLTRLADAKGVRVRDVNACILDRPRHAKLIEEVRATGAAICLIGDGDVAAVIDTTNPVESGIDIYLGSGGAPEGVLAAAALRCLGGQMQGRLVIAGADKLARAEKMGIKDPARIYRAEEMVRGDVLLAATGVTNGNLLSGVRFLNGHVETDTIVMRSSSGTIREIKARHRDKL